MPMKGQGRGTARGCAFRQRLSPDGECPASLFRRLAAQAAPWGPRSPSALQSPPLSRPRGQPRLLPRRGGRRWHRLLRRGTKVPTAACGRKCPALGKEGQRIQCGGGRGPGPRLPARSCRRPPPPNFRAAQRPAPSPPVPGPAVRASSPGARGQGKATSGGLLGGEGGKERGEAQSGPGGGPDGELHHSCLRVFQP